MFNWAELPPGKRLAVANGAGQSLPPRGAHTASQPAWRASLRTVAAMSAAPSAEALAFLKMLSDGVEGGLTHTAAAEIADALEMVIPAGEPGCRGIQRGRCDRAGAGCAGLGVAPVPAAGC